MENIQAQIMKNINNYFESLFDIDNNEDIIKDNPIPGVNLRVDKVEGNDIYLQNKLSLDFRGPNYQVGVNVNDYNIGDFIKLTKIFRANNIHYSRGWMGFSLHKNVDFQGVNFVLDSLQVMFYKTKNVANNFSCDTKHSVITSKYINGYLIFKNPHIKSRVMEIRQSVFPVFVGGSVEADYIYLMGGMSYYKRLREMFNDPTNCDLNEEVGLINVPNNLKRNALFCLGIGSVPDIYKKSYFCVNKLHKDFDSKQGVVIGDWKLYKDKNEKFNSNDNKFDQF